MSDVISGTDRVLKMRRQSDGQILNYDKRKLKDVCFCTMKLKIRNKEKQTPMSLILFSSADDAKKQKTKRRECDL